MSDSMQLSNGLSPSSSGSTPDVDGILQRGKELQATNMKMMAGMQELNAQNMLMQGMNNMFNAGIQSMSQTTASARDAFNTIGRNM